MINKRTIVEMVLASVLIFMTSCSSPKKESNGISSKVSQIDIENGHLKMELMEKVSVDAEITPYSKYKDGVNMYYFEPFLDNYGKSDLNEYKNRPVLFNQDIKEITKLIQEYSDGTFYTLKNDIKIIKQDLELSIPFMADDGEKRNLYGIWYLNEDGQFVGTEVYFKSAKTDEKYAQIGKSILDDVPGYEEKNFEFADHNTISNEIRTLVERITGRKISEKMYCVPVTEKLYNAVTDVQEIDRDKMPYPGEYYTFIMYYDIDGLPWKLINFSMKESKGVNLADDVKVFDGELISKNEWPLVVTYNADGIMSLELDSFFKIGKPYKEKEQVCTPEKILEQVEIYFQETLLEVPVTIYEISLAYDSYFTDPKDGLIENVVRPFWLVRYWDGKKTVQLVFDAYSGKYIE